MRYRAFIFVVVTALSLLAAAGCSVDNGPETPTVTVEAYGAGILNAHDQGMSFVRVYVMGDDSYLVFSNQLSVRVPQSLMYVDDMSSGSRPRMVWKNNRDHTWVIGDRDTHVSITEGRPFRESLPVYAWYTDMELDVMFSNSEVMVFHHGDYVEPDPPVPVDLEVPVLKLWTENGADIKSRTTYVAGSFELLDSAMTYSGVRNISGPMEIRGRGNSTWNRDKKPYKIRLSSKYPLLGMPSDKEWALIANYSDKSMLRNAISMRISEMLGFSWTPKWAWVEVYLNDKYQGLYNLFEHKEVNGHKVAIDVENGAAYLELDKTLNEPVSFQTDMQIPVMFKDPVNPSSQLQDEVKTYLQAFETALKGKDFADPEQGYARYIDVDSFIAYFIIEEFSKNIDGKLCRSTFLAYVPGRPMEMYHVWDFDLAWGNCNYFTQYYPKLDSGPTGFQTKDYTSYGENTGWYHRLFDDPAFVARVLARWDEIKPGLLAIPDYIDEQVRFIRPAVDRNFEKWPILGKYVWPNVEYPDTYEGEIAYLKRFYSARMEWLDAALRAL